ncbi:MAG TPA: Mur ligase domain-containing protein, partial [Planctomycetota bacterium]|nr:Mur ligase domain-containing protein [Planctomycetota bacterium]
MTKPTAPPPERLDALLADPSARVHFVGVAGSGMSALAHFRALEGKRVSGSDRDLDRGRVPEERASCERLGVALYPQDGAGAEGAALVVASTAVEAAIPDLARARALGVPVAHRAEWLAAHVRARRTVAIAGTSGKSTVVAMTFEALRGAGLDPALLSGGDVRALQVEGVRGNAWAGRGPLVVEADESDRSLVHYEPEVGVVLNLQRDHDEPSVTAEAFAVFLARTRGPKLLGEDPALEPFRAGARTFGFGPACDDRATEVALRADGSSFRFGGVDVALPVPGRHNVENAVAALASCAALGADVAAAARALAGFRGVARRFETVGRPRGAEVIDDFAHNPAKIAAALAAARLRARRLFVFFQPHGFGPLRFLRADLADAFVAGLKDGDRLFLGEVYDAGGTARRDVSSEDLAEDLRRRGVRAQRLVV